MAKKGEKKNKRWIWILVFLLILFLIASVMTSCVALLTGESIEALPSGNVAHINVHGVIQSGGSDGIFGDAVASSDSIIDLIERADSQDHIKAILIEINSPGGSAVASEEIVNAIKRVDKPVVSYIREAGASGGYWIASSTDHIFASRMSITGSVGVIASYLEFSGLLERYNVTHQRLVAGKYKDLGTPLRKMSPVEQDLLQQQLDLLHDFFLEDVIAARNLSPEAIEEIKTGQFFIGAMAHELGLIDSLGGKHEAVAYLEEILEEPVTLADYRPTPSLLDLFGSVLADQSYLVGKGIGSELTETPKVQQVNVWA